MNASERLEYTRKLKVSAKFCPRCNTPTIIKDKRKCSNCHGRVYFQGDDTHLSTELLEDWYIWTTTPFGVTGWFHSSYWYNKTKLKSLGMKDAV